ncbi:MAG: DUF3365 domain-containing protein [Desulfobacula sp.]|nr:DUF3365 domain-containing protein [Desulfobacula sp.]
MNRRFSIWNYALITMSAWSAVILILLSWNITVQKEGTIKIAEMAARTAYEKDILYRKWNSVHGGVYAPITKLTQPNIHLIVPNREIQTPDGIKLTKINPAYMTRQVYEIAGKKQGVNGHITSLNPIRPGNAPDNWEEKALKAFEKGKKEISSVETINHKIYLRYMRPLITEKQCLDCHAIQGYELGDIRGGLSVSVSLAPLNVIEKKHVSFFFMAYGLIWGIGLAGIIVVFLILKRQLFVLIFIIV